MIPTDLAAKLRVFMESAVHPLAGVREIPSDPPDLRPGQRFTATIQTALPDGTYRATVAGKSVTLALPQAVKTGDALELVAVGHSGKSVMAAELSAPPPAPSAALPAATLSRAAQLIGSLLSGDGQAPRQAAALARGEPLLPQPAASGKPLAPLLQSAVAQSGLFYESHQAQWIAGRLSTETLLREPQARHAPPPPIPVPVPVPDPSAGASSPRPVPADGSQPPPATAAEAEGPEAPTPTASRAEGNKAPANSAVQSRAATELESVALATSRDTPAPRAPLPTLPEDIAPIVRQQLDVLANQQVVLLGQIWPGQNLEWEIEDARRERAANDAPGEERPWTTSLRLVLPHLGELGATLTLDARGVGVSLRSADADSAEALRGGIADLARSLGDAGVPLLALKVEHGDPA